MLGASYIHRDLGRIIEDMSPDGGHRTSSSPTRAKRPTPGVIKDLQNQIAATSDPMKKATLTKELSLYQSINVGFPKPKRNYDALVLTATKRLSHNFLLLASYTYSRTLGNYPGTLPGVERPARSEHLVAVRPARAAHQPRRPAAERPSAQPQGVRARTSFRSAPTRSSLGLAFNVQSGTPIEVLGANPLYGVREIYILPRGSGGRTPTLTSFDLHVSYRRQLSRLFGFEAYADVFNLFNQQEVTGGRPGVHVIERQPDRERQDRRPREPQAGQRHPAAAEPELRPADRLPGAAVDAPRSAPLVLVRNLAS